MEKFKIFTRPIKVDESSLSNLISNAMGDTCGVGWWKEKDEKESAQAEAELIKEGNSKPCIEDIWARMLLNGGKLMLLDPESEWHWKGHEDGEMLWNWQIQAEGTEPEDGDWHEVGLDEIIKGLNLYFDEKPATGCADLESILEEGDFWDADCIFQYAMYDEVIYG